MINTENKTDQTLVGNKRSVVGGSTHVRFSEDEYRRLLNDQFVTGDSIPALLKSAYFKTRQLVPLMNANDARAMMVELNRIGNNINQIARHLNSGYREGWNDPFLKLCEEISEIRRMVAGTNGGR